MKRADKMVELMVVKMADEKVVMKVAKKVAKMVVMMADEKVEWMVGK